MESFNKNWLAILLIVIVFTAIGFILGWLHGTAMINHQGHCKHKGQDACEQFNLPLCSDDLDSLENVDVKVIVNKNGDVVTNGPDTIKKVIVKKVVR
jgi:hypothetical protein